MVAARVVAPGMMALSTSGSVPTRLLRVPKLLSRWRPVGSLFALLAAAQGATAQSSTPAQPDLQRLLIAPALPSYKWFASTDPQHKNKDYLLLGPGETRRIPLAAGRLERLWCTAGQPEKVSVSLLNGTSISLLHNGQPQQGVYYQKAFVLYPTAKEPPALRQLNTGAALVVVNGDTQANKFFYQAAVRPGNAFPTPPPIVGATAIQGVDGKVKPNAEFRSALSGPGVVDDIEITLNPMTPEALHSLRLRIWWDDVNGASNKEAPAVDVPLFALAGQFFQSGAVTNRLWSFDGMSLHLHAPMPYGPSAMFLLRNDGAAEVMAHLRILAHKLPGGAAALPYRFCAAYGSAHTQPKQPVEMLKAQGAGAFIGLSLGIEPAPESARRAFAYLEGNETITADEQKYEGTGTEDFFNSAWYFPDKPFAQPYHGLLWKNKLPPQVAMYRLMMPDAVPFQKSLNFSFEHASGNSSNDLLYRWVAFWYQKPPLKFQVVDQLAANNAGGGGAISAANQPHQQPILPIIIGIVGVVAGVLFSRYVLRRGASS